MSCIEEYCTEEDCTEGHCTEEDCIEEDCAEVSFLVMQLAFGVISGMHTIEDVYQGILERNKDKEVARVIRERVIEEVVKYDQRKN